MSRRRAALAAALGAALGLAGCLGEDDQSRSARDGGSIVVGVSAVPTTLDPALAREPRALQLLWLVHTPLLTYRRAGGRDGTQLVPGLARALPEVSEDGLTYMLRLRPGLLYSDGTPLRAGDFERSIERLRALHSPLAPLYNGIASIDADARSGTIRVSLARPDPTFADLLALPSSAPLPRGTPLKELSRRPPRGIGPYRVVTVRGGRRVALARVSGFELPEVPAGHVDSIAMVRGGPVARQAVAVIAGSLDVMQEPAPVDVLPEIRSEYGDRYREDSTTATVALVPDTTTPPLDDPVVRRAVSESLDGETLVRLYRGLLEPSCNVLPATVQGHQALDPCPHGERDEPPDLPEAQERIEEAGAEDAQVSVRGRPGVPPGVARYVARTLRKIGLDASARRRVGARLRVERIAPLLVHPAAFLEPFASSAFDPELAEAVAEGMAVPARREAEEAWAAADRRVVEEAYATPLGTERRPTFLSERLDAENCARFQPQVGIDLSSLCLK